MTHPSLPYLRLRLTVRPLLTGAPSRPRSTQGRPILDTRDSEPNRCPLPATQLRRVLGKALIDLFCPFGTPRCQTAQGCAQKRQCPYGVLFAASTSRRPPFALYLLPTGRSKGYQQVDVTLYGDSWQLFPWMLGGLARALDVGVGKRRRRWRIEEVAQVGPTLRWLCGDDLRQLPAIVEPSRLLLPSTSLAQPSVPKQVPGTKYQPPQQVPGTIAEGTLQQVPGTASVNAGTATVNACRASDPLEVRLLSPMRLLHNGQLLFGDDPVPLTILIARALDRLRDLYGDDACPLLQASERQSLEADAADVPIVRSRTRWVEQKDYSARSRSELLLGGKMGRLVYGRGAGRFLPILKAAEILQVGKNVTAGCGRIAVAH